MSDNYVIVDPQKIMQLVLFSFFCEIVSVKSVSCFDTVKGHFLHFLAILFHRLALTIITYFKNQLDSFKSAYTSAVLFLAENCASDVFCGMFLFCCSIFPMEYLQFGFISLLWCWCNLLFVVFIAKVLFFVSIVLSNLGVIFQKFESTHWIRWDCRAFPRVHCLWTLIRTLKFQALHVLNIHFYTFFIYLIAGLNLPPVLSYHSICNSKTYSRIRCKFCVSNNFS